MDILFENCYTRTKELAKEIYKYLCFKRPMYLILDIIIGLLFLANLIIVIFEKTDIDVVAFVLPVLFFALHIYTYSSHVKAMIKRDNEINHDKPIFVETVVTENFIRNSASTGSVNEIEFSKIGRAVQTKNLILLRSKANLIYIFRKDTFTKGTHEDFIIFLRSKGIKIK